MALPTSGPLSLNQIHIEAGGTSGTTASLNDADIRGLIGKASGATMSFSEWYGASAARNTVNLIISANTNNYNIKSAAVATGNYVFGATDVTLTINSGVTVGSTSTGTYALDTGSAWSGSDTITIVNNGTVKGRGGNGGAGGSSVYNASDVNLNTSDPGAAGSVGGPAFLVIKPCTFTNNGSVYGGGGGGGGGGGWTGVVGKGATPTASGGGGGGGGAGVNAGSGAAGGTATGATDNNPGGAGANGSATAGGAGGTRYIAGAGGAGGGLGSSGVAGGTAPDTGFSEGAGGSGGLAGYYVFGSLGVSGNSRINGGSGIGGTVGGRSG